MVSIVNNHQSHNIKALLEKVRMRFRSIHIMAKQYYALNWEDIDLTI